MKKYKGVHFRTHDDAGIAKINVYNKTDVITKVGDTHGNTTIDGLPSTNDLVAGMLVTGTGIASGTKINTIDSGSEISVTKTITGTSSDITINFYPCVVHNKLIDLFQKYKVDASGQYEDFIYWKTITDTKSYEIQVEHSGTHNAAAVGPDYSIDIVNFVEQTELTKANIAAVMTMRHTDHYDTTFSYNLTPDSIIELDKQQTYFGNGVLTSFVLSSTNRAAEPVKFSNDGGTTWYLPNDINVTWGSNSPDYDDETIDANGYFGINFINPPADGNTVIIKYVPKANKYKVGTTINLPTDGISYVNNTAEVRLLDHAVELIK